ncbi:MAG TPA: ATP-binding protein [Phycisphaerae bacterium]|nr:ATP-binding protein [Phycisphaerae bacterium]
MRTTIFPAKFDQLEAIRKFAGQAARDMGMDDSDIYTVELAVDEACTNIIEHAYRGIKGGDIECTCDAQAESLTIILRDHGKPFNPSSVPYPNLDAELKDRKVGGLGVYIIRKLMDEVHFEPLGESGNVLTLIKRWSRQ